MSPFTKLIVLPNLTEKYMSFPCGKCPNCLARRISGWSFRLQQQAKVADTALFVTLTYNTDSVPISNNHFMSLCKRDVQLFFKRLRKSLPKDSLKVSYFAVGEYGGKTMRPHYHLILYNALHEFIDRAWTLGAVNYGKGLGINAAECGYCLKYMSKPSKVPVHSNDDRVPEFQLCSKGLGANYVTSAIKAWHKADLLNRFYLPYEGGKKLAMPRYYKELIYSKEEMDVIAQNFEDTIDERYAKEELEICRKLGIGLDKVEAFKLSRDLERVRKLRKSATDGRFL